MLKPNLKRRMKLVHQMKRLKLSHKESILYPKVNQKGCSKPQLKSENKKTNLKNLSKQL